LRAVRKVREPRDGGMDIFLDKPPTIRGSRVVGTFHSHVDDFGPSGEYEDQGNGTALASGDYLANYSQGVPGLVLTKPKGGGIGYYVYGPDRGFFGVGLPAECRR
jgi:hypothetical protein